MLSWGQRAQESIAVRKNQQHVHTGPQTVISSQIEKNEGTSKFSKKIIISQQA
jgi:hypothetical protein